MKVYCLFYEDPYEWRNPVELESIFSSEEAAEAYRKQQNKPAWYFVQEWEVKDIPTT